MALFSSSIPNYNFSLTEREINLYNISKFYFPPLIDRFYENSFTNFKIFEKLCYVACPSICLAFTNAESQTFADSKLGFQNRTTPSPKVD